MIILPSLAYYCTSRILHLRLFLHMHHTGSQENEVELEEQETLVQGLPEEEELQECPDHRPSFFEKGKPRSILSFLNFH